MTSSGARANQSGKSAEHVISAMLTTCSIAHARQHGLCLGVYGAPIKTDLYILPRAGYPHGIAIESKWQDAGGSADEKLPYLVENIRTRFPCPAVIVIDGVGFRPGAVAWLARQIDDHLIAVFTLAQFVTWTNRTLR